MGRVIRKPVIVTSIDNKEIASVEAEIDTLESMSKTDDILNKIGKCKVKLLDLKIEETVKAKNSIKFTKITEEHFKESIYIDGKVPDPDPSLTSLVSGKVYFGKLGYQKIPKNLESLNKSKTQFGNVPPPKHILKLIT